MAVTDIISENYKDLEKNVKSHVDNVLDSYASFTSSKLEIMTHQEDPWLKAREGYNEYQRCEVEISETIILEYYGARLQ